VEVSPVSTTDWISIGQGTGDCGHDGVETVRHLSVTFIQGSIRNLHH